MDRLFFYDILRKISTGSQSQLFEYILVYYKLKVTKYYIYINYYFCIFTNVKNALKKCLKHFWIDMIHENIYTKLNCMNEKVAIELCEY